jgi:hypothetical protein
MNGANHAELHVNGASTLGGDVTLQGKLIGSKHVITVPLGAISATGTFAIPLPSNGMTLTAARIASITAITASDTNYWSFGLTDGATTLIDNTVAANTTKATGGNALAANTAQALTLSGTPANLNTAASDVLVFSATKTASAVTMAQVSIVLEFTKTG